MAMVNNLLAIGSNVKDSRWLTLEVCREYQRNKCTRTDTECKFAHPPPHVEVQNGRVTACFDSIKGKCQRKDPPCKYLHPPQHLREQLLQNGRNNLILKNLQMQAAAAQSLLPSAGIVPGMLPTIASPSCKGSLAGLPTLYSTGQLPTVMIPDRAYGWSGGVMTNGHPYLASSVPTTLSYNPYNLGMQAVSVTPPTVSESPSQPISGVLQAATSIAPNKITRPDRLEQSPVSQVIPYKRVAVADGKTGLPMYQPGVNPLMFQQHMAMPFQQGGFFPGAVAFKSAPQTTVYPSGSPSPALSLQQQYVPVSIAGHPPSVPRF